jgi:site-specific recombinase XerD
MTITELKERFLAQYTMASEFTKSKYRRDLDLFISVCKINSVEDLNSLQDKRIGNFYEYSKQKEWSPGTINQRLGIAKLFTFWAFNKHFIESDFLCDVKKIRTSNSVRYTPSDNECDRFIEYIKEHTSKQRLYIMTSLLLRCGLRKSEVCGLKVEDVNENTSSLRIVGKGKKIVEQPVPITLMAEIIDYINKERKDTITKYISLGGKDLGFLFLSGIGENCDVSKKNLQNGNQVDSNAFYQQIKRYAKLSGIPNAEKLSPHGLRRAAGTKIYNQTGDINTAKEFLRHSNITTTEQCYINYDRDKIRKAVDNISEQKNWVAENKLASDEEYELYLLLKKKFANI